MLKAVETEEPHAITFSFADDAHILSLFYETAVQRGVNTLNSFCTLTDMALNGKKTSQDSPPRPGPSRQLPPPTSSSASASNAAPSV